MKNKVVVTISGRDYTMVAVEDEAYVRRCASHVDAQLREINSSRLSQADAAVLAAMNIADQYFKEQEAAENLRRLKNSVRNFIHIKIYRSAVSFDDLLNAIHCLLPSFPCSS